MFYFTATVSETSTLSIFYIRSVVMMSASGFSDVAGLSWLQSCVHTWECTAHTHTHTYRTYTQPLPHPTTHYRPSLVNITDHLTVLTCSVNTVSVDEAHMKVCLLHSPNTSLLQDCKSKTGSSAPTKTEEQRLRPWPVVWPLSELDSRHIDGPILSTIPCQCGRCIENVATLLAYFPTGEWTCPRCSLHSWIYRSAARLRLLFDN